MARTSLMAGNWKMNLNHVEATGLVEKLAFTLKDAKYEPAKSEAAVIVPFTDLRSVQTIIEGDKLPLKFGAQDVSVHASGAYTGEISAGMLAKLNCSYVVVGHSERREYHGESDALIGEKAKGVFEHGMTPIVCCGEVLEIRKAGAHVAHVLAQVKECLEGLTADQVAALVIAYEPVWAIGTGEASDDEAQEAHALVRGLLAKLFGDDVAQSISIHYGGSMKPENAAGLLGQSDIDGGLIGGAALKADSFLGIVTPGETISK